MRRAKARVTSWYWLGVSARVIFSGRVSARTLRYRRHLDYLRDLGGLYGEGLKGVDLAAYRQLRRPAG